MAAKGNVDLIIRAKNEATKNVDAINRSLKELSDQQAIVGDTAGKADDQIERLGLELAKLRTNAQNLKALGSVTEVINRAGSALERQSEAAKDAAAEYDRVSQRQRELADETSRLSGSLKTATSELKQQETGLKSAKTSLADLSKETTALTNREKSLTSSIGTVGTALEKRREALGQAVQRQAELSTAIASSEKVTKAQQNSLDAANRAIERRQKALEETVTREAALRAELADVQTALRGNVAATEQAGTALAEQTAKTAQARAAAVGLSTQVNSLSKAEREVAKDVRTAGAAVEQQSAALAEARTEYAQVENAAAQARAAVAAGAIANRQAGNTAGQAAVQVATFAARLAVLSGASTGKTTNPLQVDPAALREAEAALKGYAATVTQASNESTEAAVSAEQLTAAVKGISTARNSLNGIDTAITAQRNAVDGASAAWKTAEAEVRRLALAIKATDEPSEALATAFGRAQGSAKLAKDEFIRQSQAATTLGAQLREAGIGSGDLNTAQVALAQRLQSTDQLMTEAAQASERAAAAIRKLGNESGESSPKVGRLGSGLGVLFDAAARAGSATNPLRAFKNELFAMVAASAGLYAIKEQLVGIFEAGTQLAANQSKYATAFGGIADGNRELAYAREVALNLKLPLGTLTKSYADLALAAKGTKLEGQGARDVLVGFAQTARVNGSTNESLEGTFVALTQVMSKGKVQAEELRGQLGDRLPGALQLMAEGLGVTTEKLETMLEKGQLTREALLNMAAAASSRVGPQLAAALDSPAAKLADFQNRLLVLKETIAGSGFLDAVADALDKMAKALSTPEAIQGAKDLGSALADLVTWLVESTKHLDEIIIAVKGLGAAWLTVQFASIISGLAGMVGGIGTLTIAVFGLDLALTPLLVGLGVLAGLVAAAAGAFVAFKLYQWVYDNVPAFAEGMLTIQNSAKNAFDGVLQFWELTGARLKSSFTNITGEIADIWYKMLDSILSAFPRLTESLNLGDFAADIAKRAQDAAGEAAATEGRLQMQLDGIRAKYAAKEQGRQKELQDNIADYYKNRIGEEEKASEKGRSRTSVRGGGAMAGKVGGAGTELVTADTYVVDNSKELEKAAKKAATARLALEKSVADQMFTIRAQLEKKSADNIDEAVAAVPAKYAKLLGQLQALGKTQESEEVRTVKALIEQEQANLRVAAAKKAATAAAKEQRETEAANTKAIKEQRDSVTDLVKTREALTAAVTAEQKAGLITQAEAYEKIRSINMQMAPSIQAAADAALQWAEANKQIFDNPAKLDLFISQVKVAAAATKETHKAFADLGTVIAGSLAQDGTTAVKGVVKAMYDLSTGAATFGDTLQTVGSVVATFFANLLEKIAEAIIQQLILNSVSGALGGASSGATTGSVANLIGGLFHNGGTVGSGTQTRSGINPAVFSNAVKYHGGGVAGLKSNEVPAILEEGETIRTKQQEAALAQRQAMASAGSTPQAIKVINQFDSQAVVEEALNTAAGEKLVMNIVSKNRKAVRQLAK